MENGKTVCKNCGNHFDLRFCNKCGQHAGVSRITWREIFERIPHALTHIDHGFYFTIWQLCSRPGHAVREYLDGKRKPYYNPFLALLLVAGACSYLYVLFHLQTVLAAVKIDKLEEENKLVAHKYFAIRTLFFCLVCSIGDYLIFFKRKHTLPELIVANVFMLTGVSLLQLLCIPLLLLGKYIDISVWLRVAVVVSASVYLVLCRYQLFKAGHNRARIARIIFAVVLYVAIVLATAFYLIKPAITG